jgi:hypothetical protein
MVSYSNSPGFPGHFIVFYSNLRYPARLTSQIAGIYSIIEASLLHMALTNEATVNLHQRLELPRKFKQYNGIYYTLFRSNATVTAAEYSS